MGGRGSGTWPRFGNKGCVEQEIKLDMRFFRKHGLLKGGVFTLSWSAGSDEVISKASIIIHHDIVLVLGKWTDSSTGMAKLMKKFISLTKTNCRYGGYRKWFICPSCGRRMGLLVLSPNAIGCRHCFDLVYSVQCENPSSRALRKRNKIADRLDRDSVFEELLLKPKGMHWRTYDRLIEAHDHADLMALYGMVAWLR